MAGSKPGERRGGRKKGSPNRKTKELQAKVAAEGLTPLDVMLDAMRHLHSEARKLLLDPMNDADDIAKALLAAASIAKDAAPYVHPKLASIEHSGPNGGPIPISLEDMSDDELLRIAAGGRGGGNPPTP